MLARLIRDLRHNCFNSWVVFIWCHFKLLGLIQRRGSIFCICPAHQAMPEWLGIALLELGDLTRTLTTRPYRLRTGQREIYGIHRACQNHADYS
jgi:hypothetical protein